MSERPPVAASGASGASEPVSGGGAPASGVVSGEGEVASGASEPASGADAPASGVVSGEGEVASSASEPVSGADAPASEVASGDRAPASGVVSGGGEVASGASEPASGVSEAASGGGEPVPAPGQPPPAPPPRAGRDQRAYVIAMCAIIGGAFAYAACEWGQWRRLTYFPLRGELTLEPGPGIAMVYAGIVAWGLGGLACGAVAGALLCRLFPRPWPARALHLLGAWAITAVLLAGGYFTWALWPW